MKTTDPSEMYRALEARLHKLIRPMRFSAAINLRLERITALLAHLGDPHRQFHSVHIGGTSGKGSTAALTEAVLRHHGARTGLHLSPHIQIINERHQLDGAPAPTSALARCWPAVEAAVQAAAEPTFGTASYFETQLALSMMLFAQEQIDTAVVEVGLGGTLDATNVLPAEVAVLTNVGLDHTEILGDTPLKIAADKAGIIKPGQTVLSAVTQPDVQQLVRDRCARHGATLCLLGEHIQIQRHRDGSFDVQLPGQRLSSMRTAMIGDFQAHNAALALGAARAALKHDLDPERARQAIARVQLPGRTETVQQRPLVILDGAHNPDKIRSAARAVASGCVAVVALKAGKDARNILPVIQAHARHIIVTRFRDKGLWRSMETAQLRALLPGAQAIEDPDEAVEAAISAAGPEGTVWITGSLYLIGDVRSRWFPIDEMLSALEPTSK
jgi:dihydrofolate synthase/folylpolyglutamate synthase